MVAGEMDPLLVLTCIEHLPEDSATVTEMRGGTAWRGWSREARLLADIYDALNVNTAATGRWKKKPPKFKPYPRPGRQTAVKRRRTTIADLRRMAGMAGASRKGAMGGSDAPGRPGQPAGDAGHQAVPQRPRKRPGAP